MRPTSLSVLLGFVLAGCASNASDSAAAAANSTVGPGGSAEAPAAAAADAASALSTVPCRYLVPKSVEGKTFHCADLTVPENRRDPNTKTIKLHVAIVNGKPGGIPTVELIGGPGYGSDDLVGGVVAGYADLAAVYGKFLAKGDMVFFDERGTGRSLPRLSCDGAENGDVAGCLKQLTDKGIDVVAYDTVENADDVHDLKVALGAAKIDLHGISYGTRLGLEILKRHADDIHAAIIDGVMPPDVPVNAGFEVSVDHVLSDIFKQCAADAKCNAAYPSLDDALTQLKAKLSATPFVIDGDRYGWDEFVGDLTQQLYEEGTAAKVPYKIHRLLAESNDDFKADADASDQASEAAFEALQAADASNPLAVELDNIMNQPPSAEDTAAEGSADGMYLSVTCNDYTQHETLDGALTMLHTVRTVFQDDDEVTSEFNDCKTWPTRPSDAHVRDPATFAGPVLVMNGQLDPATPIDWAKHAADSLPNHQLVVTPTGGHGLMDECAGTIKGGFFDDATKQVDGTCATSRVLTFFYPETSALHSFRSAVAVNARLPMKFAKSSPLSSHAQKIFAATLPAYGSGFATRIAHRHATRTKH